MGKKAALNVSVHRGVKKIGERPFTTWHAYVYSYTDLSEPDGYEWWITFCCNTTKVPRSVNADLMTGDVPAKLKEGYS